MIPLWIPVVIVFVVGLLVIFFAPSGRRRRSSVTHTKGVPTAVKLKGKAERLMPIADALIEKGVVQEERRDELTRFLLGIGEDRFAALCELMA